MPTSDAYTKTDRLQQMQLLFWRNQGRKLRTKEIATLIGVNEDTANHYLAELSTSGRLPVIKEGWYWFLPNDVKLEVLPVTLTLQEAAALYLAGRLLAQTQDKRNQHIVSALTKIIGVMPMGIATHQHALLDMLVAQQANQRDTSQLFSVLALSWATHRTIRLRYTPPRRQTFECLFSPYLLEPSAIGRTFYAIGHSSIVNDLRTYKMERIEAAELTEETFDIPADFDGPALLSRAWGVMYGDEEPVTVVLHFSKWVTKRVYETIWHPSQNLRETAKGCEWTAQIGDLTEILPWIRGWGSDCEVLEPQELREDMQKEARRLAHRYGVASATSTSPDEPDMDLLSNIFEG